ncbi:hypothetical protein HK405_006935 [Cladochytrium tenue]|nr:hypothetical protein HK405_006935 [Cladochytrium tenue]
MSSSSAPLRAPLAPLLLVPAAIAIADPAGDCDATRDGLIADLVALDASSAADPDFMAVLCDLSATEPGDLSCFADLPDLDCDGLFPGGGEATAPSPASPDLAQYRCLWEISDGLLCGAVHVDPHNFYMHLTEDHVGRRKTHNLSLHCKWAGCSHSARAFSKRDHIVSHCRAHVSFRANVCPGCHATFKWPHDLKKHGIKTRHFPVEDMVFQKDSLFSHKEKESLHGTQPYNDPHRGTRSLPRPGASNTNNADTRSMSWGSNDTSTPPSIFVTPATDSFKCELSLSHPIVPPDMSLPWGLSVNYCSAPSSELASPTNLQLRPPSPAASLASYASDDGLSFGFISDAELDLLSGLRSRSGPVSPALAGPTLLTTPAAMQPRATLLAMSAPPVHDAPPRRSSDTLVPPASGPLLTIPGLGQDPWGRRLVPRSASDSAHVMTIKPVPAAAAAPNGILVPVPLGPSLVGTDHRFARDGAAAASLGPGFTVTASDDQPSQLLLPGRCLAPVLFPSDLRTYTAVEDAAAACPSLPALSESSVAEDDFLADLRALAAAAGAADDTGHAETMTSCNVMLAQMEYDIR